MSKAKDPSEPKKRRHLGSCCKECAPELYADGGKHKHKSKVVSAEEKSYYAAQTLALQALREAYRNPSAAVRELAARHRLSPSERLAPHLSNTPQPVLGYIERLESECAQLSDEVSRLTKIVERYIEMLPGAQKNGKRGGRGIKKDDQDAVASKQDIEDALNAVKNKGTRMNQGIENDNAMYHLEMVHGKTVGTSISNIQKVHAALNKKNKGIDKP
jgi:predicted RNase H-like nuclease (RuvC/YqgF family)